MEDADEDNKEGSGDGEYESFYYDSYYDGRGGGVIPFLHRRAHARTAVDISRAAGQAEQQGGKKRTHGNRATSLPRPAHK